MKTCGCFCPITGVEHNCTAEIAYVVTLGPNEYNTEAREIHMCASCADTWEGAKPRRVVAKRVNVLLAQCTSNGRRI